MQHNYRSDKLKLNQVLDEFIQSRIMYGLASKSITDYQSFCNRFVKEIGSNMELQELSQSDINKYIIRLMDRSVSKTTVSTYMRHLKVFLKWCSENYSDIQYDYKKIKVPKVPKKNVLVYSDDNVRKIFNSIVAESEWIVVRNKCIIALMLDSGLRQAEITRFRLKDIDFTRNTINVHGKGEKDRVVPLGKVSTDLIKQYLQICPIQITLKDYLFVTKDKQPITTNAIKLMVTKLSRKLPFDISSHKLRHNFATNYCLDQYSKFGQIDIYQLMYLLGHEDVKTTSRYLHFAYEIIATMNSISHVDAVMAYS